MGDFKYYFIHPALESANTIIFHHLLPEVVEEVDAGVEYDMKVEDMDVTVLVNVVSEKDVAEGAMVITHMNYTAGTENLC